jgi:hypothetical protein
MSRRYVVLCGVPALHCTGGKLKTDQKQVAEKCHGSSLEAFRCMKHYLVSVLKFKAVGSREFAPPDGGPIRVLTKKCRYGARMRTGKMGERFQPEVGRGAIIG